MVFVCQAASTLDSKHLKDGFWLSPSEDKKCPKSLQPIRDGQGAEQIPRLLLPTTFSAFSSPDAGIYAMETLQHQSLEILVAMSPEVLNTSVLRIGSGSTLLCGNCAEHTKKF